MDELEFALENIDGVTFERFTMAFLRDSDYDVHESGEAGADGGWDAQVEIGDREGIAHASVQNRWRRKLRDDADKVHSLEEERSEDYDLLVFVTNQSVTGVQEMEMKSEIEEEYGWSLEIIHRDNILGELRQNKQELAEEYLDIDLNRDQDHLAEIEELRDRRLDGITDRTGYASDLVDEPAVVLHIIPNGIFSKHKVRSADDIPTPSILYELVSDYPETRGKYKITYSQEGGPDEEVAYGVLQNDGLYESVTTSAIMRGGRGDLWIRGGMTSTALGLDPSVVITAKRTLKDLAEMGFSGTVFVSLTFLGASDVKLETERTRRGLSRGGSHTLDTNFYTTELYPVQIGSEENIENLEPLLSEVWRQFGHENGTPNIVDGMWDSRSVRVNREVLLEEGDL